MMVKNEGHLSCLMTRLNISGKEIAISLRIDVSLVSKYRNRKRRISKETASLISRYIVEEYCSEYACLQTELKDLLEPYSTKSVEAYNDSEFLQLVTDYILADAYDSDEVPDSRLFSGENIQMYSGRDGLKNMISDFAEKCDEESGKIVIGEFAGYDYSDAGNYDIYSFINQLYMKIINSGRSIDLIMSVEEKYKGYENAIKWLQLYARDRMNVYTLNIHENTGYNQNIIVERGHQVALSFDSLRLLDNDIHLRIKNEQLSNYFYGYLSGLRKNASLLIEKFRIHRQGLIHGYINDLVRTDREIYMLDSVITYRNMPEDILHTVLDENEINGALRNTIIESYSKWKHFYEKYEIYCIFDYEELVKHCFRESCTDLELSAIAGREITVRKELFREHLRGMVQNSPDSFHIACSNFSEFRLVYNHLSMISQDDNLLMMWSTLNCKNCLCYNNKSYKRGCNDYIKNLWNSLEHFQREKKTIYDAVVSGCDKTGQ